MLRIWGCIVRFNTLSIYGWLAGAASGVIMRMTMQKAAGGGRCPVRRATVTAALLAACISGCARTPEQAVVALVQRLGGRTTAVAARESTATVTEQAAITRIDLAHTAVTDGDLAILAAACSSGGLLDRVEELDLTHTGITDRGLELLVAFPAVRKLSLTLTRITDAGLAPLAGLTHLTDLYLIETRLTDAAVDPLSQLSQLRMLVLLRTGLSAAGIARLRHSLPQTMIQVEPSPARPARRGP